MPHRARARVGAEVPGPVLLDPSRDEDARPGVLDIHFEVRIPLVILQADVEERLMALDERCLEEQRLADGAHDDVLEVVDLLA